MPTVPGRSGHCCCICIFSTNQERAASELHLVFVLFWRRRLGDWEGEGEKTKDRWYQMGPKTNRNMENTFFCDSYSSKPTV